MSTLIIEEAEGKDTRVRGERSTRWHDRTRDIRANRHCPDRITVRVHARAGMASHRKLRCALAGVALVLLGFKTDPNLLSTGPQTLSGWIHGLAFVLLTLSLLLTFFVMGWGLIKDPLWRRYGWHSLATGILFVVGFFIPGQIGTYIFLTVILAWMFVMALRLGSVA
jgi:hypothetical protein